MFWCGGEYLIPNQSDINWDGVWNSNQFTVEFCTQNKSSRALLISTIKMQILQLNRKISIFCGICTISGESVSPTKFVQSVNVVIITINLLVLELSSIYFAAYQLQLGDIVEFLFGFLVTIPLIMTLGSYFTIIYRRDKIHLIFDELQKSFDRCNFDGTN